MKSRPKYLISFEVKALDRYRDAISPPKKIDDRITYIGQCSKFLFKSICIINYNESENSRSINEPIIFLEKKNFFGKRSKADGKMEFHEPKLGIIKKETEYINSKANPVKHAIYKATKDDFTGALSAIQSI